MTDPVIFRAYPAAEPAWGVVVSLVIGLVAGLAAGAGHFVSLRWNTRLFMTGKVWHAPVLQAGRLLMTAAVLYGLARLGAIPLLAGMTGFMVARQIALRYERVAR
jgi:F1F0 ATPase subunit 2